MGNCSRPPNVRSHDLTRMAAEEGRLWIAHQSRERIPGLRGPGDHGPRSCLSSRPIPRLWRGYGVGVFQLSPWRPREAVAVGGRSVFIYGHERSCRSCSRSPASWIRGEWINRCYEKHDETRLRREIPLYSVASLYIQSSCVLRLN